MVFSGLCFALSLLCFLRCQPVVLFLVALRTRCISWRNYKSSSFVPMLASGIATGFGKIFRASIDTHSCLQVFSSPTFMKPIITEHGGYFHTRGRWSPCNLFIFGHLQVYLLSPCFVSCRMNYAVDADPYLLKGESKNALVIQVS